MASCRAAAMAALVQCKLTSEGISWRSSHGEASNRVLASAATSLAFGRSVGCLAKSQWSNNHNFAREGSTRDAGAIASTTLSFSTPVEILPLADPLKSKHGRAIATCFRRSLICGFTDLYT